jgi:hypothetical protein
MTRCAFHTDIPLAYIPKSCTIFGLFLSIAVTWQELAEREKKENFDKTETGIPVKSSVLFNLVNVKSKTGNKS